MVSSVVRSGRGHRLTGDDTTVGAVNRFLGHLETRCYSPATVRAYAFELSNFASFLTDRRLTLDEVRPTDLFDYLDWQQKRRPQTAAKVVPIRGVGAASATMNRRIASVRGLFEHMVIEGTRQDNPVPAARRSSGLRSTRRGLLGHVPATRQKRGGRLVRQPQRLPESLDPDDVASFLNDLETHRDRAIVLAMVFGGLRAAEVRGLRLANIDMGLKKVRVVGKGGRERIVPVDPAFFSECAAYVRTERPPGCRTPECFVVLRGPTTEAPLTEDGLRKIFRTHRDRSGAMRVRPHRLRHTYGTELVNAGMSLQALMALLGHRTPEMTIRYARLSSPTLRSAYDQALGKVARRIPVAPVGLPAVPDRVSWLSAEMLKTRVAHGFCARELAAEACPYANVCETCPNFVTKPEFAPALGAQLEDVRALRDDAERRGWESEVSRHERVIVSLERHLQRLGNNTPGQ